MEDKSLLNLYLTKVGAGDDAYVEKLCRQLADRLVFIPVLSSDRKGASRSMTLNVCRDVESERNQYLVFTSERKLKQWSSTQPTKYEQVSLLGADFCAALDADSWVLVDKGESAGIALKPEIVRQIAATPIAEDAAPAPSVAAAPSAAPTPPFAPVSTPLRPMPHSIAALVKPTIELSPEKIISEAPKPLPQPLPQDQPMQITPQHLEALRASVASRSSTNISRAGMQRPVIFSSAQQKPEITDDDTDKKKKSLLGFLKSAKR